MFAPGIFMGWSQVNPNSVLPWKTLVPIYLGCVCWTIAYETVYQHQVRIVEQLRFRFWKIDINNHSIPGQRGRSEDRALFTSTVLCWEDNPDLYMQLSVFFRFTRLWWSNEWARRFLLLCTYSCIKVAFHKADNDKHRPAGWLQAVLSYNSSCWSNNSRWISYWCYPFSPGDEIVLIVILLY